MAGLPQRIWARRSAVFDEENTNMGANHLCDAAKARSHATPREPFLFADWERVVFLHFTIAPEVLRAHVPSPFQLELWHDQAWLSLVALTMRRFRPGRRCSAAALI